MEGKSRDREKEAAGKEELLREKGAWGRCLLVSHRTVATSQGGQCMALTLSCPLLLRPFLSALHSCFSFPFAKDWSPGL